MISYIIDVLRWRVSKPRIRRKAQSLIRRHGDAAMFRALDLLVEAEERRNFRQARFWKGVAQETAHQVRRRAILASIMCPLPAASSGETPPPAATMPGAAMPGSAAAAERGDRSGHIRLVHPKPGYIGETATARAHGRRSLGSQHDTRRRQTPLPGM